MVQINYIQERDELELQFKQCDTPYCKKLNGGITLEFNTDDELTSIILPNFFKLIQRQPDPNINFEYDKAIFDEYALTLILKMNNQSINVKIDLTELDK